MSRYSARAQWNTANARLANKPFDNLFADKPCECYNFVQEPDDNPGVCGICGKKRTVRCNRMNFRQACKEAARRAVEEFCAFYVYDNSPRMWGITSIYRKGWLFKVYPGGRSIYATEADKYMNPKPTASPEP